MWLTSCWIVLLYFYIACDAHLAESSFVINPLHMAQTLLNDTFAYTSQNNLVAIYTLHVAQTLPDSAFAVLQWIWATSCSIKFFFCFQIAAFTLHVTKTLRNPVFCITRDSYLDWSFSCCFYIARGSHFVGVHLPLCYMALGIHTVESIFCSFYIAF